MHRGLLALGLLAAAPAALAEPYLAVRHGFKCMQCHVNPTGGGMRNAFGNSFAQNLLAAEKVEVEGGGNSWSEYDFLELGGDLRTAAVHTRVPGSDPYSAFELQELRVYVAAFVIPGRLLVYVDQQMAPGSINQEAYARLGLGDGRFYVKAGQMYLPYGLRLEDDSAFVRVVPGVNMTTPDTGVELGFEDGYWSVQLAASNGGRTETEEGKQGSLRAEYVRPFWRAGASFNLNHLPGGDRQLQNVFAGVRTGPLAWLAELDYVLDDTFAAGERGQLVGLLETNWEYRQGFNVKLAAESLDPDDAVDEDQQARYSLVWEHTPIQFLQARVGARFHEGIPQNELQNRRHYFIELHGFF